MSIDRSIAARCIIWCRVLGLRLDRLEDGTWQVWRGSQLVVSGELNDVREALGQMMKAAGEL